MAMTVDQARNLAVYGNTQAEVNKAIARLRELGAPIPANAGSHVGQKQGDPRRAAPATPPAPPVTPSVPVSEQLARNQAVFQTGAAGFGQPAPGESDEQERLRLAAALIQRRNAQIRDGQPVTITEDQINNSDINVLRQAVISNGIVAGRVAGGQSTIQPLAGSSTTPIGAAGQVGAPGAVTEQAGVPGAAAGSAASIPTTLTPDAYNQFLQENAPAALLRALQSLGLPSQGVFGRFLQGLLAPLMAQFVGTAGLGGSQDIQSIFQQGLTGGMGPSREQARSAFGGGGGAPFTSYLEDNPQQAARLALYARPNTPVFLREYMDRMFLPDLMNQYAAGPAMQGGSFLDFMRSNPAFSGVFG